VEFSYIADENVKQHRHFGKHLVGFHEEKVYHLAIPFLSFTQGGESYVPTPPSAQMSTAVSFVMLQEGSDRVREGTRAFGKQVY
jgi:hypothetical protein